MKKMKSKTTPWLFRCRAHFSIYPAMLRSLKDPVVWMQVLRDMGLLLLVSIALACFCVTKNGGMDLYMSTFLPMLCVLTVLFVFTEALDSSRTITFCTSILILTGLTLQILLMLPAKEGQTLSAFGLVAHNVIALIFAAGALPVIRWLLAEVTGKNLTRILVAFMVCLYLALFILGTTHNSTRAWISVGSFEFQVTEVIKVVALISFAVVFVNPALPHRARLDQALGILFLNAVFLLMINELGTLCVLGVSYILMAVVYQPSLKRLAVTITLGVLAAAMVLSLCFLCFQAKYPPQEETEETISVTEAAETESEVEEGIQLNPIGELGAKIYRKFQLRMELVLNPDSVDPDAGGYQARKAKESLVLSNWFGSALEVAIPVAKSDYIFCYLLLKMGVCFGIAVLLMLLCILLSAFQGCLQTDSPLEGAVGLAFVFAIVAQALIAAASSTGYFITVGLPFAFLADGGSAMLTNYTMIFYLIYAVRRRNPVPAPSPFANIPRRKEKFHEKQTC